MMQEFGYKNSMQVPRLEKITVNVGLGEATQNAKVGRYRGGGDHRHCRAKASDDQRKKGDRELQIARRGADRLHGDFTAGAYVRVSRPLIHVALAARARFQGDLGSLFRWPWQLFFRSTGADYFSRDPSG